MRFVNIGFGNLVAVERIVAVISPDSAPIKRLVSEARQTGHLIDATYGHKTNAVLVTDSDHVVLSFLSTAIMRSRMDGVQTDEGDVFDE